MNLVTVTDHDSIGAAETLRKHPDFFLSEEVSCVTPSGTRLHVGVYDINERDHVELQRRRGDLLSLIFYLQERRLLFSVNHVFSRLTGRRTEADFVLFEHYFPLVETRNGQMPARGNRAAARLAKLWGKSPIAGSDAHSRSGLGSTYTTVPGARSKAEFMEGLRRGSGVVRGESGQLLEADSLGDRGRIRSAAGRGLGVDSGAAAFAGSGDHLANCLAEAGFHRKWAKRIGRASAANGRRGGELEAGQVHPQFPSGVLNEYQ